MPSLAFMTWRRQRRARIQQFLDLRLNIAEDEDADPSLLRQVDRHLVLCLAAEFQGFTRQLHDLATGYLVQVVSRDDPKLSAVLGKRFRHERKLDLGNANPGALGADFGRFGLKLWPAVETTGPDAGWNRDVDLLNSMRNAIAHANDEKLAELESSGAVVNMTTVTALTRNLDELARVMDDVVGTSLHGLLGGRRPW